MELNVNSVWRFDEVDGFNRGIWRLLKLCPITELVIVILIKEDRSITRPKPLDQQYFANLASSGAIEATEYQLPGYLLRSERDFSEKEKNCRDERFQMICQAIADLSLPTKLALNAKVPDMARYAQEAGTTRLKLSQLLCLYWKFGQQKNALLPAYSQRGAPGKIREPGAKKRGRPRKYATEAFTAAQGINMDKDNRSAFMRAMKKNFLRERPIPITDIHEEFVGKYYSDEIERAEIVGEEPNVPTLKQFYYWKSILVDPVAEINAQSSRRDWLLNKRALLSSASVNTPLPGCCFEIDATVADPHLVSELNRNHCIGRATVYAVADRASHMIVGIYVGLLHESWAAARQALFNCVLPKKEYCARYNVDISEEEWPCHHMGQALVSDRGGLLAKAAQQAILPNMNLEFTATDRADMKGIVENCFGRFKGDVFDKTEGTTLGKPIKRRQKNPKNEALYTLKEFTEILILAVQKHNNHKQFDDLSRCPLLIEADLPPTPRNFWNIHRESYVHALRDVAEREARALFLEPVMAAVTSHGFEYKGMRFSHAKAEEEGWFVDARANGRWKVEARINMDDTSQFYVRRFETEPFERCRMLSKTKVLEGKSMAEVLHLNDWMKYNARLHEFKVDNVRRNKRREELRQHAKEAQKKAPSNKTKKEKGENIRERRKGELDHIAAEGMMPKEPVVCGNVSKLPVKTRSKDFELISQIHSLAKNRGQDGN